MVKMGTQRHFLGQLTSGIDRKGALVLQTINFVRALLPAWRDDPDRPYQESENRLNLQLCKFLDSKARNEFPMVRFDHEEYQQERRSVDLSASPTKSAVFGAKLYTIYDPILVFEGKRLPAPSNDRYQEYVTGREGKTSGGIQRFKLGLHGGNLEIAAMIGYVQKQSTKKWHRDINNWISELASDARKTSCSWSNDEILELLIEDAIKGIASYRSVHSRKGSKLSNNIEIYHLWLVMVLN